MNKLAQDYYQMGQILALEKLGVDLSEVQQAMEIQRAMQQGAAADRIGSDMEKHRRMGAIGGTFAGAGIGGLAGAALGNKKSKALAALLGILGMGAGGVAGNLGGRLSGMTSGAASGALASLPGVMQSADFLSQPLSDY
jgi:hypothetical protein